MKYVYWACYLMLASMTFVASANVTSLTATIDKNPVLLDESVTLQVTATGGAESDALFFSNLSLNFRLSKPSVSKSTQIINFDRTTTTTWTLQLFPRATGKFIIPSFTIDGQSSDAIELTVLPVNEATRAEPRDFYVTTEVSRSQVYLQQQVEYKIKIYLAADIQRGSLTEPVLDGAVIEQLGEDKEYQELVNGVRYRVIERNFAVLPQASGNFVIDGPVFQAEVLSNTRQNFAFFNRSKNISRVAPSQNLTVLPIPQSYQHTWLPSEQVQIDEQWQGNDNEFVQGEPITRTVTLTALGLIEEQLPPIEPQYHPSFKTYPEQAEKATVKQNNRLIAQSVQRTAIIPSETGTFVLPEIRVPWFDVSSGETRFASIPARSVTVIAPLNNESNANTGQTQSSPTSITSDDGQNVERPEQSQTQGRFPVVLFGLDALHFALILLIVALLLFLTFFKQRPMQVETNSKTLHTPKNSGEHGAWLSLTKAIDGHDTKALQSCLRTWLQCLTNQQIQSVNNSLLQLGADDASNAFNDALANQYSPSHTSYNADTLKQALTELREREQNRRDAQIRTNMYPIT